MYCWKLCRLAGGSAPSYQLANKDAYSLRQEAAGTKTTVKVYQHAPGTELVPLPPTIPKRVPAPEIVDRPEFKAFPEQNSFRQTLSSDQIWYETDLDFYVPLPESITKFLDIPAAVFIHFEVLAPRAVAGYAPSKEVPTLDVDLGRWCLYAALQKLQSQLVSRGGTPFTRITGAVVGQLRTKISAYDYARFSVTIKRNNDEGYLSKYARHSC